MTDLTLFDQNGLSNPKNNIFGLPFPESDARLVVLPVPWEVTVSYHPGTARAADHILQASYQVDLFDRDAPDAWKQGIYMRPPNQSILMRSDYLRKEAELFIGYVAEGGQIEANKFMTKTLREVNEGSVALNQWVFDQTSQLLSQDKLVGLLGGDHSTILGYLKALGQRHPTFGILQIDAHCDLRQTYSHFTYSHASIMYNILQEVPSVQKLVQMGIRDYCTQEWAYIQNSGGRIQAYPDHDLKRRRYEGQIWKSVCDDIIAALPEKVYISFDIDGLDPKLCPHTGTPVPGGLEAGEVHYLCTRMIESGRQLIGFDLVEVGVGPMDWDANVGARILWSMCNLLIRSNS